MADSKVTMSDEGMSPNGMVRPCSRPSSKQSWRGGSEDKEHAMSEKLNSEIAVIGIDIGKNSFHLVGQDRFLSPLIQRRPTAAGRLRQDHCRSALLLRLDRDAL
jgi:hypothetical protein